MKESEGLGLTAHLVFWFLRVRRVQKPLKQRIDIPGSPGFCLRLVDIVNQA